MPIRVYLLMALLTLTSACVTPRASVPATNRTLLVVVAHPDDESIVSPLLARHAREGARVHLIIATDGSQGVREHAGVTAGPALAALRAEESRCAAQALGIQPPMLLGLPDGGLSDWQHFISLEYQLRELLRRIRPDAILTWGPDGGTGHPDHRMVSNVVTALVQEPDVEVSDELYYPVVVVPPGGADQLTASGLRFYSGDPRYFPVRGHYEDVDRERARQALACHASQFTLQEREGIAHIWTGVTYLRKWNGGSSISF